jgi:hypothetical protein
MALRYTAIYNACVGQISLQLDPAPLVLYKIPPKLRVQICGPLIQHHMKLGETLQKLTLKVLYDKHGPEKEHYVPLCILWWLLMTVYRHNLNDSTAPAFIPCFTEIDDRCKLTLVQSFNCGILTWLRLGRPGEVAIKSHKNSSSNLPRAFQEGN